MRRLFATLLVGWFGLLSSDLPIVHACAMHGGDGSSATHATHAAHAHHGAAPDVANDSTSDTSRTDDGATHCQCLGECCAASVSAIPGPTASFAATTYVEAAVPAAPLTRAVTRLEHLLPFAIGPPGLLTA